MDTKTYHFNTIEERDKALRATGGVIKRYKNKIPNERGYGLKDVNGKVHDNIIYFSLKYTKGDELLKHAFASWPTSPQMPLIVSDINTLTKLKDKTFETLWDHKNGNLLEVCILRPEVATKIRENMYCGWCTNSKATWKCPKCRVTYFCDEKCYNLARNENKHTEERCNQLASEKFIETKKSGPDPVPMNT